MAVADGNRVRQIVRCLLSNAMRYGGDWIKVRVGAENGRATVTVADDGCGVPPGHERSIFDAFHRARNDDGKTHAMGLGLYVAHHLALLMDGDLTYDRRSGWTMFELELPSVPRGSGISPRDSLSDGEAASTAATGDGDVLAPPVRG